MKHIRNIEMYERTSGKNEEICLHAVKTKNQEIIKDEQDISKFICRSSHRQWKKGKVIENQ